MRYYPLIICAVSLFSGTLARADQLIFENGDTLNGRKLDIQEGIIYFQTDNFGIIRVPEDQAHIVDSSVESFFVNEPTASVITEAEAEAAGVAIPKPPPPAKVAEAEAQLEETESTLLANNPVYRFVMRYNPFMGWKSKISLGYTWESGENRKEDWSLRFSTERAVNKWQFRMSAQWDYATQIDGDGVDSITEDYFALSSRIRRDLSKRIFAQSNSRYLNDGIKDIEHEVSEALGVGYRYFTSERIIGTITPSIVARYRSFNESVDFDEELQGWDYFYTLYQDFDYKINERMTFEQEAQVSFNADSLNIKAYSLSMKLVNRITDKLTIDILYSHSYDIDVGANIDKNEQKVMGLLGVEF